MMKRVLFFLIAGVAVCSAVPLTIVTNVEPQPFTAQVKRLIEATDYLGVPFEAQDKKKLQAAVEQGDAAELQGVLDRYCLLAVHINPEMRVKVAPGPAKAELIEGLKPEGTAILNADDALVMKMREKHLGKTLTFGIDNPADVSASDIDTSSLGKIDFRLRTPLGEARASLAMSGRHNLSNALAASAVGTAFSLTAKQIAEALGTAHPPKMRGEVFDFAAGFTVIDDSYNSNPRSLLNMVRTMAEGGQRHKRLVVIAGEMLELGPDEVSLHRDAGREIAGCGINVLWGVRGLATEIVAGATGAGLTAARFFNSSDEVAEELAREVKEGDLILVKGSRGVATDKVVKALRERFPLAGE